jgi:ubiquinone/menaquinone biosynthesis C-methylase UbiE
MNYDEIGSTYTATRQADPRIGEQLVSHLGLAVGSELIDIGAGTGNYSYFLADLGFSVTAIEPSKVMRDQAKQHGRLTWVGGSGEGLPFSANNFHGAVMTLSLHHFTHWQLCIKEALRVSGGGPLVIFAFDPLHKPDFWLFDYFPTLAVLDALFTPSFKELENFARSLGCSFDLTGFPLPKDLCDTFAAAPWGKPGMYLEERVQNGISTFSKLSKNERDGGGSMLKSDLSNGRWLAKYGSLNGAAFHDRGYGFIRIQT